MIVIADSGASKTDWLLLDKSHESLLHSDGISPFYQNTDEIFNRQKSAFDSVPKDEVKEVFFYGSGCIKDKTDVIVADALSQIFPKAKINVEDDMLGAARALLGNDEGIACILGTGANSCHYNGKEIVDKVPTLGFILGDEGSGAHMGKLFLNDYFKRAIPEDLKEKIETELHLEIAEVLASVYREEYPSRYLANFSRFLHQNKNNIYTQNLIKRSFSEFFFRNVEHYTNYQNLQVNFSGSISFHHADLLREVAFDRNIKIGKIIEKPIEGLKTYHTKY
jgi:N-acetylglucosamine kinase-like BadF-type ATPase